MTWLRLVLITAKVRCFIFITSFFSSCHVNVFKFLRNFTIERCSNDLEMKTREQNRNNKRTEIEQYDWFVERIQTLVAFDWLSERSNEKTSHARELSRNQWILRFDVMLQHHWPIEGCRLHIRVLFGGKTKSPCFDLFIHWLIKQIMKTYRNHFSRSNENRSIEIYKYINTVDKIIKHCIRFRLPRS